MPVGFEATALARTLKYIKLDLTSAYGSELVGMVAIDTGGNLGFVNPMAARLLKEHAWKLVGRPVATVMRRQDDKIGTVWPFDVLAQSPNQAITVVTLFDTDGCEVPHVLASASSVFADSGELAGALVLFCKMQEDPMTRQLLGRVIALDQQIYKLHQEKCGLIEMRRGMTGEKKVMINQVIQDVENVEDNIRRVLRMLFSSGTALV